MPVALFIFAVLFIIAGVRGKTAQLLSLVYGDFTGDNNFVYWFLAIVIIGSLGYIDSLRGVSRSFLILILLVLLLHENQKTGNLFSQFTETIGNITANPAPAFSGFGGGASGGAGASGTY